MSTTTIFLIRHGQTDWNLAGKIQGHSDIPLNATGKEQAKKVAGYLKKKQVSLNALYSSDLQRAHQTAQEIAELFALEIILTQDLREGHFGKFEGLTKQERHDLYGPLKDEELPEKVGAEPREQVVARVMNFLKYIAQNRTGNKVAVVTHGFLLSSLLIHLGHKVEELPALNNVSVITLIWHEDRQIFVFESIEHAD